MAHLALGVDNTPKVLEAQDLPVPRFFLSLGWFVTQIQDYTRTYRILSHVVRSSFSSAVYLADYINHI